MKRHQLFHYAITKISMNWKAVRVQRWSYFARDLDHVERVFDEYENASNVVVVLLISSATAKINQVVAGYEYSESQTWICVTHSYKSVCFGKSNWTNSSSAFTNRLQLENICANGIFFNQCHMLHCSCFEVLYLQ